MSPLTSARRRFHVEHALLYLGAQRDADGRAPHPGWGNLGDWGETRSYPMAARALAQRVLDAAGVGEGDRVVDAGCGWGEQAVLMASERGAARVLAIDPSPDHVARARARVTQLGLESRVEVRVGSAARLDGIADASVDAVVAVDAAYHFDTRSRFLAESRRVLRPGGRVAWTDLVPRSLPRSGVARRALEAAAGWSGMPAANLVAAADFRRAIADCGLEPDPPVWLTQKVLGGFGEFSARQTRAHLLRAPHVGWLKIWLAGRLAGFMTRRGLVEYGLFAASLPAPG